MANRVFSHVRRESLAALLVAVGAAGGLTACNSGQPTTYRPSATPVYQSPSYSTNSTPAPSTPTYTTPAPKPATGGQMACGKGKCG